MRDFDMGFKLTYSYSQIQKKKKERKKKISDTLSYSLTVLSCHSHD